MPAPAEFKTVNDALLAVLPDDAMIVGLEVSADLSHVTIWTTTPGSIIGRKGRSAELVRNALRAAVGKEVHLHVELADGDIADGPAQGETMRVVGFDLNPVPPPRIPRPPESPGAYGETIVE